MADKFIKAYPNYDEYMSFPAPHNTEKWIETVKTLYFFVHKGLDKTAAIEKATTGWSEMEKKDFGNWLRYYEEGTHKKYSEEEASPQKKVAQVSYWVDANKPGYFVPNQGHSDNNFLELAKNPETNSNVQAEEDREVIEKQRSKILSRLDSTEKLIRSTDGQTFAGGEIEALLHIIYELKKKIQTVNKVSRSTRSYADMIVREANILTRKGFTKAASVLIKFADETSPTMPSDAKVPPPAVPEPANPIAGGGLPGSLPGEGPGLSAPPSNAPASVMAPGPAIPTEEPLSEGMDQFLKGLDTSNISKDTNKDDDEVDDDLEINDGEFVVEAQAAPPPQPVAVDAPVSPEEALDEKPKAEIEVEEDAPTGKDYDALLDTAFANLSVGDVVAELEMLAKIFKVREVPRKLARIDMMLDYLGLAALFPTLAEAMNKSLDSNQYIASRIEDILSRLRGTMETKSLDLGTENVSNDPEAQQAKKHLENQDAKEKARKQQRKEQSDAELDTKPAEIEVEEDLGGPTELSNELPAEKAPAPAPIAPIR